MDNIYDFTNCKRVFRVLGGTDRKFAVEYDDKIYMLKFSENHAKKTDISTSSINNVISEYISSHIAASMKLPVHNTVLGLYQDEIVVGCEDFRAPNENNMEFKEFVRAIYEPKDIKRTIQLSQIYNTLNDKEYFNEALKEASIQRYWDTFIADALVGNFDRHIGNWGYLSDGNKLSLAPIYDFGSSLLPQLSDDGMESIIDNDFELFKRCLVFPSAALFITSEKNGKVGYYDMMSSNFDTNCTTSVKKISPRINLNLINDIINETPLISDIRKEFYKKYISLRKSLIIDRAYKCCILKKYDYDSFIRMQSGIQYTEDMLRQDMREGRLLIEPLNIPKYLQEFPDFDDEETIKHFKAWTDTSIQSDGMPSFEKSKNGTLYKIYVNYESSLMWKKELTGHQRFELFKNNEHVCSVNRLDLLLKEYKKLSRKDAQGQGVCR